MATKADKKNAIRQGIIDSAGIYSQSLAGKTFLYVYGEEFFEVSFPIDHFLHLTGVETKLSAKDFYKNAKKAKLTSSQFYFDARHPYANARKKLPCLKRLPGFRDFCSPVFQRKAGRWNQSGAIDTGTDCKWNLCKEPEDQRSGDFREPWRTFK